ncbi:uncharacterized protein LOC142629156 [Castanea sativa]|uniref:uncharacterized protein LOC142629156 n=1 Tax=Castanea sativa TaxID=21020 RepID=UPI003F64AC35
MDSIITPYQNALIMGRNISNNILLAREIIDVVRKKKGRRDRFGVLKIDMSKAYDRVNWNFLKAVLTVMNFDSKWINWIMEGVSSVEYTLLINGKRITILFKIFNSISGQSINLAKFDVFCSPNMPKEEKICLVKTLQVNLVQHPNKYLGVRFKLRVLDHVCNKMDSISRAFWRGHEHDENMLHLLNWDRISRPKGRGTVGDLIDHNTRSWKVDLVRRLYPFSQALQILQIPISKTNFVLDKLLWRFSKNGEYQVKKAYELLTRDDSSHPRYFQANMGWWRTFWKIKVPLKISTFIWKLLHNCLPTFLNLHARGISSSKLCPLCNEEEESHTHLFLHYPFARACWHGSTLALHTSEFIILSMQQWLKHLLSRNIQNGSDSMNFCRMFLSFFGQSRLTGIGWFIKD